MHLSLNFLISSIFTPYPDFDMTKRVTGNTPITRTTTPPHMSVQPIIWLFRISEQGNRTFIAWYWFAKSSTRCWNCVLPRGRIRYYKFASTKRYFSITFSLHSSTAFMSSLLSHRSYVLFALTLSCFLSRKMVENGSLLPSLLPPLFLSLSMSVSIGYNEIFRDIFIQSV